MSTDNLKQRLRQLSKGEHDDLQVGSEAADVISELEAQIALLRTPWRGMDSAPKDGTVVLVYRPTAPTWGRVTPGGWDEDKHANNPRPYWQSWFKIGCVKEWRYWEPTCWTPLPVAPDTEDNDK